MSRLSSLIEEVRDRRGGHSPVYVIGFSMGAFAAWRMAEELPHLISAAVPVAGGAFAPGKRCGTVPVWAIHGMEDTIVPAGASEEMVRGYQSCGANPRLSLLPGVGHKFRAHTLGSLGVFEWLRFQRTATPDNSQMSRSLLRIATDS